MRKISLIERVRRFGHSGIDVLGVFGRSAIFLFHALLGRGGIGGGFGLLIKQLHSVGVMSLVIIVVSGVFIGMVLALQGFNILSSYGSEQAVGQMVALTLLRELGPVVTALLFAGRAGSALTAEIGNMKSTEQLSSLEMIGVDPLKYIIAPRLWAGFISLPVLAMIFSVVGIWGGSWVAVDWLGVYEGSYWSNMQNSVTFADDVLNGIIKSIVFAFVVTWIAVFQGYDCEPTSEGISRVCLFGCTRPGLYSDRLDVWRFLMQNRTLEIGVGLFLLAGILALLLLALRVSGLSPSATTDTYKLYAYFDNIAGLTVRAKVTMAGVTIGKVTAIDLDRDSFTGRVTMQLEKRVDNLPTDSTASILTAGLLGEKYIGLSVGGEEGLLKDGSTIHDTQSSLVLEDLIGKFLLNTVSKDAK
jgi:phospholipid/cholesterol/gamma-HCH transport system permease protein